MEGSNSYRRAVTEKVEAGWRITEETSERVTLERRTIGTPKAHLIIAVLTIWWAMGVPNLLYGAYKYVADAERTVVWKDGRSHAGEWESSSTESGRAAG